MRRITVRQLNSQLKAARESSRALGVSRRRFLRRMGLASGALAVAPFNILSAAHAGDQVRCALIGCGIRGMEHVAMLKEENLVAIVDVDSRRHAEVKRFLQKNSRPTSQLRAFTDYRRMFDQLGKGIDAVFIATPNHHHAFPATLALQSGIAAYVEKPLTHDIGEARALRQLAASAKAATQMGHQGHCEDGYRRLCEYIWGGVIGQVRETHSWTNRANGGTGPRPKRSRPPVALHWDLWLGPAPYRDFHADVHPHEWHGWYDFGNGSIGNMGCHILDGVFWALKVEHPEAVEVEQLRGGTAERYPLGCRVRYDVPARAGLEPLKAYWYEGLSPTAPGDAQGLLRTARGSDRYLPSRLLELSREFPDEELASYDNGTLYLGDKGVILTGTYGDKMHIVPWEQMRAIPAPPKTLARPQSVFKDFLDAVRNGSRVTAAPFEYGARLTEFTLLANLAMRAGAGRKLLWDGAAMRVTNLPELNVWLQRTPRPGWGS